MKKILFTLLSVFAFVSIYAEEQTALVIQLNNGSTNTFFLTTKPIISMPGENVEITSESATTSYKRSEVTRFYFIQADPVGIKAIETNNTTFNYLNKNNIKISGITENSVVSVITIDGKLISTQKSDASGNVLVSLEKLPQGVYIISYANRNIKIKR